MLGIEIFYFLELLCFGLLLVSDAIFGAEGPCEMELCLFELELFEVAFGDFDSSSYAEAIKVGNDDVAVVTQKSYS